MNHFITYADNNFRTQAFFAKLSAKVFGGFGSCKIYQKDHLKKDQREKFKNILQEPRGGGYWLWKPLIIVDKLYQIEENEILFYSDAGVFFLKNISNLITEMNNLKQDILGFELPFKEKQWTKCELIQYMNITDDTILESNQILASFILIRNTEFSRKFFHEFIQIATNKLLLTDIQTDTCINCKEFIEHRHDQSIFSLLYKKTGYKPICDPSQFGIKPELYLSSSYQKLKLKNDTEYNFDGTIFYKKHYDVRHDQLLIHYRQNNLLRSIISYILKRICHENIIGSYSSL